MKLLKSFLFFLFTAFLGFSISAQDILEKEFDFRGFTKLDVSHAFNVEVTQGNSFKVLLKYPPEMEDKVKCEMADNELRLSAKNGRGFKGYPLAIIQMPELQELEVSGASTVALNDLQGEGLEIDASGASSVKAKLSYNNLKLESSGASNVAMSGTSNTAKIYLSGATTVGDKDFKVAGEFILDCSGASNIELSVDGDMYIELSGASNFDYYGQGTVLDIDASGASNINKH